MKSSTLMLLVLIALSAVVFIQSFHHESSLDEEFVYKTDQNLYSVGSVHVSPGSNFFSYPNDPVLYFTEKGLLKDYVDAMKQPNFDPKSKFPVKYRVACYISSLGLYYAEPWSSDKEEVEDRAKGFNEKFKGSATYTVESNSSTYKMNGL